MSIGSYSNAIYLFIAIAYRYWRIYSL